MEGRVVGADVVAHDITAKTDKTNCGQVKVIFVILLMTPLWV